MAARFRVDGGPDGSAAAAGNAAAVPVPEGTHGLEYWGEFSPSVQELVHHNATVVVDTTSPLVALASEQGKSGYTLGEKGSFRVTASDAGTGLQTDPTATGQPIDTSKPGNVTVSRTAVDNCANQASALRTFRILPAPCMAGA